MSNAALLADAIDAAITLARAYALWLLALAVLGTLLLLATIAAAAWAVRGVWRGVTAAVRGVQRRSDSTPAHTPVRPADGRTADPRYEEAA